MADAAMGSGGEGLMQADVAVFLADAEKLTEVGSSMLRSQAYEEAVDHLTRALEIRVQCHGEMALECAPAYYKLGCALLYKVQTEADPLVDRPAPEERAEEPKKEAAEDMAAASASGEGSKSREEAGEEVEDEGEGAEEGEEEGEEEEEEVEEEEESDLELAWKMLDIARVIYAKRPERTLAEVDVITALADVSLERELFAASFEDYEAALAALEGLVEPDSRRIAELCFKISLAKQLDQRPRDALEYCRRAISVCERRVARLSAGDAAKGKAVEGAAAADGHSSSPEGELDELRALLVDLREKLDDLQQMATAPTLLEAFKSANPEAAALVTNVYATTLGVAAPANGEPAAAATASVAASGGAGSSSAAAAEAPVTNLGVVGRGVKRATLVPLQDDAAQPDAQAKKVKNRDDVQNGDLAGDAQVGSANGQS